MKNFLGINWKVRAKNPMFHAALAGLVGMMLSDAGFATEGYWRYVESLSYVLVTLGVINDPVVKGFSDSERAKKYDKPQ